MQDIRARLGASEGRDGSGPLERRPSGPVGNSTSAAIEAQRTGKAGKDPLGDKTAKTEDGPVEFELSIPLEHTTAAHKLLRWPSIQQFVHPITKNEQYVMQGEERRGLLRVWGRGEGGDPVEEDPLNIYSPGVRPERDDPFRGGLAGLVRAPGPDVRRPPVVEGIGGLNPDGSLKIDTSTMVRLMNSYNNHIHILHPFMDTERLTTMVCTFGDRYNTTKPTQPRSPYSVSSPLAAGELRRDSIGLAKVGKRKRSSPLAPGSASSVWGTGLGGVRNPPDRSIGSALVLLVAALGQICEHKEYLPGPVPDTVSDVESATSAVSGAAPPPTATTTTTTTTTTTDSSPPMHVDSPPVSVKHSPASSHSSGSNSTGSPQDAARMAHAGRSSSLEQWPGQDRAQLPINAAVIPGLAYYAYATDILGNHLGGNELVHVQAGLLAGLYAGQLGRVLESWKWINWACTSCQVLVRR